MTVTVFNKGDMGKGKNSLGIPETILSGRKTRTALSTLSDSDSLMLLLSMPEIMLTNLRRMKISQVIKDLNNLIDGAIFARLEKKKIWHKEK